MGTTPTLYIEGKYEPNVPATQLVVSIITPQPKKFLLVDMESGRAWEGSDQGWIMVSRADWDLYLYPYLKPWDNKGW